MADAEAMPAMSADFRFAIDNPHFADCTLRLVLEGTRGSSSEDEALREWAASVGGDRKALATASGSCSVGNASRPEVGHKPVSGVSGVEESLLQYICAKRRRHPEAHSQNPLGAPAVPRQHLPWKSEPQLAPGSLACDAAQALDSAPKVPEADASAQLGQELHSGIVASHFAVVAPPAHGWLSAASDLNAAAFPCLPLEANAASSQLVKDAEAREAEVVQVRELKVCAVVLASRSVYFKHMFQGSFQEASRSTHGAREVVIRLKVEEEEAFMDLLGFIHTGAFPLEGPEGSLTDHDECASLPSAHAPATPPRTLDTGGGQQPGPCLNPGSVGGGGLVGSCLGPTSVGEGGRGAPCLARLLRMLVLADRFDVEECVAQCVARLRDLAESAHVPELLGVLELPDPLRGEVLDLVKAVERQVVDLYSPMLGDFQHLSPEFLELSETGLKVILEEGSLDVEREDHLAAAALAWVERNCDSCQDKLDALAQLVWPRLRIMYLSPSCIVTLTEKTLSLAHSRDPTPLNSPEVLAPLVQLKDVALEQKTPAYQSHTPLVGVLAGQCMAAMVQAGLFPGKSLVDAFAAGSTMSMPPRRGYRPPTESIRLHIHEFACCDWEQQHYSRPKKQQSARSSPVCVHGRWLCLEARLEADGLVLSLEAGEETFKWHNFSERFHVKVRFGLETSESGAELRRLGTKEHEFCEKKPAVELRNALGMSWRAACSFEHNRTVFPGRAMRLRADVWLDN